MTEKTNDQAAARLLRVGQVAERLAISQRAVWAMLAAGTLPAIRIGRRATRIDSRDVDRLVEELRAQAVKMARAKPSKLPYRSIRRSG